MVSLENSFYQFPDPDDIDWNNAQEVEQPINVKGLLYEPRGNANNQLTLTGVQSFVPINRRDLCSEAAVIAARLQPRMQQKIFQDI